MDAQIVPSGSRADVMSAPRAWLAGGVAGIAGVCSYVAAITIPWPETQFGTSAMLVVASAWPLLSIVYAYALYSFVAAEQNTAANRLGLLFAVAAFTTVLAMVVVQLAVGAAVADITRGLDEQTARALRRGLRMIDLGLDVAWDMLIGTALVFWGVAIRRRRGFGAGWALPSVAFGIALITFNAATFPWPPGSSGLFDIGPFIAAFILGQAGRLAFLARRASAG